MIGRGWKWSRGWRNCQVVVDSGLQEGGTVRLWWVVVPMMMKPSGRDV